MHKQAFLYLALSIVLVIFASTIHNLIIYIDLLYVYCIAKLAPIFSTSSMGVLFRNIIVLTLLPLAITTVPALAYRAFKSKMPPYYTETTWLVWLVIMLSNVLIR